MMQRQSRTRARWIPWAFVACQVVVLAPILVSRYLPFCDLYGAMGIPAALIHRGDPVRAVDSYFRFRIGPTPTALYFTWAWLLGGLLPLRVATSLFLALFVVAGPPLALAFALRSFGRDPLLGFLGFALVYNGVVWFGFVGASAALTLTILTIALANEVAHQRTGRKGLGALALSSLLLASAHAFSGLIGLGMAALCVLLSHGPGRRSAFAALAPGALYELQWLVVAFRPRGDTVGTRAGRLVAALTALADDHGARRSFDELRYWFLAGARGSSIDDALAIVVVVTLVALLVFGIRGQEREQARDARPWLLLALALALYFILPLRVLHPINWWGVRVRMLPLAALLAIVCVRSHPRGLPRIVVVPAVALSLAWALWMAHDFRGYFNGVHMAGFDEMLEKIPPGKRVILLSDADELVQHYDHASLAYVLSNYVARSGGLGYPLMHGTLNELWAVPGEIQGPEFGFAASFNWAAHARDFDYFVIKDAEARPTVVATPPGALEPVGTFGLWHLYRKVAN